MNLFNETERLQTFSQGGSFNPDRAPDIAAAAEREFQRYQGQLRYFEDSRRTNQQTKLRNARKAGEDLVALGEFSKSAGNLGTALIKRVQEADEIKETYNFYFGDNQSAQQQQATQAEEEVVTQGEQEAVQAAQLGVKVEQQTGSAEAAEMARTTVSPLGQAATGDKTLALQASSLYPSWIGQFLQSDATIQVNGQSIPIRVAATSMDPGLRAAALRQGRMTFFNQMGLSNVSKRNIVKFLVPQMMSAEASSASALGSAAIKQQRDENTQRIQGLGYTTGRTLNSGNAQTSYEELSNLFFTSGTGMTQAQANEAAVTALIAGAVASGNPEAVESLRGVVYNPNAKPGPLNTIGGRLGALIDKGVEDAKQIRDGIKSDTKQEIQNNLYSQLAQTTDPTQRAQLVSQAAAALRQVDPKAARELEMNWAQLSTPAGASIRATQLEEQIRRGEIRDASQIRQEMGANLITPEDGKRLIEMLGAQASGEKPGNKEAAQIAGDWSDRASTNVAAALGLTRDRNGIRPDPKRGQSPLISAGDFEVIEGAIQRDVNRVVNNTIAQNPGLSQQQLNILIAQNLRDWTKDNLMTEGGKFYIGDIVAGRGDRAQNYNYTDEQRTYWTNLIDSPKSLNTAVAGNASTIPQDLTNRLNPGQVASQEVRNSFNPLRGDKVLTRMEVEAYAEDYKNGQIDNALAVTAQSLGMTPLALLQQQLGAYRLPPLKPRQITRSNPTGVTGEVNSGVDAANLLMTRNVPLNSAAMIAGNLSAESAMRGQRPYWVLDDGAGRNGGLLSWNRERLARIEARFGRPVQQISNAEQVLYVLEEMERYYPDAYAIVMNPMSTDRQLRRAMFRYIGWGIEGDRFQQAASIRGQLNQ